MRGGGVLARNGCESWSVTSRWGVTATACTSTSGTASPIVGHMSDRGTSIVDVRDPRQPRSCGRIPSPPNTHGHKVQIVGDILLVNREKIPLTKGSFVAGLDIYDISDPLEPRHLAFWPCGGKGVHRMT